jgi:hypothetical protein
MGKAKNLTGQKFGKLTVIRDIGRLHGGVLWECVCECGRIANVRASNLKSGDSKTCGKRRQSQKRWFDSLGKKENYSSKKKSRKEGLFTICLYTRAVFGALETQQQSL